MARPTDTIAIIGAGLSGAVLAHLLVPAQSPLVVYEKGRGPGGRMSTRRTEHGRYNHGAAGFIPDQLDNLPSSVLACVPPPAEAASFKEAANGYVRTLLAGATVHYQVRVSRLVRERSQWCLIGEEGHALGRAETVLITAPAPQAADLTDAAQVSWSNELRQREMAPSWVVLLGMSENVRESTCPQPANARWRPRPPLPQYPQCVVYEAAREWTLAHLEATSEEVIADCIDVLGLGRTQIKEAQAHRWRYANCLNPLSEQAFWDPQLQIGIAGDAFSGPSSSQGIVRALHSATELAARVRAHKPDG